MIRIGHFLFIAFGWWIAITITFWHTFVNTVQSASLIFGDADKFHAVSTGYSWTNCKQNLNKFGHSALQIICMFAPQYKISCKERSWPFRGFDVYAIMRYTTRPRQVHISQFQKLKFIYSHNFLLCSWHKYLKSGYTLIHPQFNSMIIISGRLLIRTGIILFPMPLLTIIVVPFSV